MIIWLPALTILDGAATAELELPFMSVAAPLAVPLVVLVLIILVT